jgi:hypothetical protein
LRLLGHLGFEGVRVRKRFDCFLGTSKEKTARKFGVRGVNISATKPAEARRPQRRAAH